MKNIVHHQGQIFGLVALIFIFRWLVFSRTLQDLKNFHEKTKTMITNSKKAIQSLNELAHLADPGNHTVFYLFMFQKLSISNCKSAHFVSICTSMNICVFSMQHGSYYHYLLLYIAKNKFNIIFENCLDIIFNIFRLENNDSFGT